MHTSLALTPLDVFWIVLLVSSYMPVLQRRIVEARRWRMLVRLQGRRHSRVITLVHRQETISFLGIPLARYIDVNDAEEILNAIHLTPPDLPIDLIVHTPGGLVLAASQIAHALNRHPGNVRVMVPHYAMSGGTLIALAANEIIMDPNAVLGPVDPQLGEYAAASILSVLDSKPPGEIILADVGRKAIVQVAATVQRILERNGVAHEKAQELSKVLSTGTWTHDYPIDYAQAKELGLPVSDVMPREVYALMALYRTPTQRRPGVEYVAVPANTGRGANSTLRQ